MNVVSICVPVVRRYDLLRELILSLELSEVPVRVEVMDNGLNEARALEAAAGAKVPVRIHVPSRPMGVAASWNWFLKNVPEERIISNDDIRFYPESVGAFVAGKGDLVFAHHGYSCFLMRDSCVEKVGLFDEDISPDYAYFEDCDYSQRMGLLVGIAEQTAVTCRLDHGGSQTNVGKTEAEVQDHHRRFMIAQANYHRKWGARAQA